MEGTPPNSKHTASPERRSDVMPPDSDGSSDDSDSQGNQPDTRTSGTFRKIRRTLFSKDYVPHWDSTAAFREFYRTGAMPLLFRFK
ncbi:hypothetical protein VTN96DRAFT_10304 [Rasamsonia emersonii]